jgi:hypothetical protein
MPRRRHISGRITGRATWEWISSDRLVMWRVDVVPPKSDVAAGKVDVDPPKDDVACPVSMVWGVP